MTPDELDDLLDQARPTTPQPDAAFADGLETRLLAVHQTLESTPVAATARRIWVRPLLAAACLVVVLVAIAVAAPSTDDGELTLDRASDARIVLPDGTVVAAEAGLVLPDGTIVTAGDEPVVIDGIVVPPGATVIIRDGRVGEPTTDDTALGPRSPDRDPPPRGSPTTTSGGVDRPDVPTTQAPPPTLGPRPTTVPPATTPTTKPQSTTTSPVRPAQLALTAARGDGRSVGLSWSEYQGGGFARTIVVRTASRTDDPPPRPERPADGTKVVDRTDPGSRVARDTLPSGVIGAAYRVFVLDQSGHIIAISNIADV